MRLVSRNRQGLPILAKSGYFFNKSGSPLASDAKAGITTRWWDEARRVQRMDAHASGWASHIAVELSVRRLLRPARPRVHARLVRSVHHARRGPRLSLQPAPPWARCVVRQCMGGAPSPTGIHAARAALHAGCVSLVLRACEARLCQPTQRPHLGDGGVPHALSRSLDLAGDRRPAWARPRSCALSSRGSIGRIGASGGTAARERSAMPRSITICTCDSKASGLLSWTACGAMSASRRCSRRRDELAFPARRPAPTGFPPYG